MTEAILQVSQGGAKKVPIKVHLKITSLEVEILEVSIGIMLDQCKKPCRV